MLIKNDSKKEEKINFVIGLGRSGFWAAKFLKSIGKKVIVWESKENKELFKKKELLNKQDIDVYLNKKFLFNNLFPYLNQVESVVVSPAIPIDHKTIIKLKEKGIMVIGEINLAWQSLKDLNWIGITGTNGKTTVTHLLSHILSKNKLIAPFAGNIGTPLCKLAYGDNNKKIDWLVAELSSYQIEIAPCIKPKIGIWTTFTADHLDRHKNLENYFKIKNNLLKQSKFRIYNYDDKNLRKNYKSLSNGIWITANANQSDIAHCDYWINNENFIIERREKLFSLNNFKLKGNHNAQNLLLAVAASREIGLSSEKIKKSLVSYKQLPHRLETIYKNNEFEIVNDSKATNFDSSIAGINSIKGYLIIISGGRFKSGNSNEWVKIIKKKATAVFLFGESSKTLKKLLLDGGFKRDIFTFSDLSDVIDYSYSYLENNKTETILFSPSCSSFDQFRDYEERGDIFRELISKKFI